MTLDFFEFSAIPFPDMPDHLEHRSLYKYQYFHPVHVFNRTSSHNQRCGDLGAGLANKEGHSCQKSKEMDSAAFGPAA